MTLVLPRSPHLKSSARFRKTFLRRASHHRLWLGRCDRCHFRSASKGAIEQASPSHELENCAGRSDAASGFHFCDQRTGAVAFHRDAWFGANGGEDAGGAGGECGERVGEDVWDLIRTCFGENMVDVDGVPKCS